jgi:NADPH:quinone reductase-like Zn-dependent oxidoreductase
VGQNVRLTKSRKASAKNCGQIAANRVHASVLQLGHAFAIASGNVIRQSWSANTAFVTAAVVRSVAVCDESPSEDFTRVLPGGFDVVFDGIGEDGYRRSFTALKRGGLLCAYGYSAGVQA